MTATTLTHHDFALRLQASRRASALGVVQQMPQRADAQPLASSPPIPPDVRAEIDAAQLRYRFGSSTPDPDRFAGQCVAVTSLSPNPLKQARQQLCLQSWSDIGLQVTVVNTDEEVASCKLQVDGIRSVQPATCNLQPSAYDRPSPRISTLINVGKQTGLPFLLINSDIEIYGDPQVLSDALAQPEKLTIGVRYNHDAGQSHGCGQYERWGLDCFLMTPAMAESVPDLPFAIGKPVWDYWLPHHFRSLGYEFHWIRHPFFFHQNHPLAWSQKEWLLGSQWMAKHYGLSLDHDSAKYRRSL